jgi:hypothetical protein
VVGHEISTSSSSCTPSFPTGPTCPTGGTSSLTSPCCASASTRPRPHHGRVRAALRGHGGAPAGGRGMERRGACARPRSQLSSDSSARRWDPSDLVERIRDVPAIEEARGLEVSVRRRCRRWRCRRRSPLTPRPGDLISLAYAKALTRGRGDVRVAVIDTGVDARHRELPRKVVDHADFVALVQARALRATASVGAARRRRRRRARPVGKLRA